MSIDNPVQIENHFLPINRFKFIGGIIIKWLTLYNISLAKVIQERNRLHLKITDACKDWHWFGRSHTMTHLLHIYSLAILSASSETFLTKYPKLNFLFEMSGFILHSNDHVEGKTGAFTTKLLGTLKGSSF